MAVGETVYVLELSNFHDRNTVAVEKDGRIVDYLPRKISCIHAVFLKIGGTICLHCDWKMVGKTARQAKVTDYSYNLLYHPSSIFHCTNYLLI